PLLYPSTAPSPSTIYTLSLHDALPIYLLRENDFAAPSTLNDHTRVKRDAKKGCAPGPLPSDEAYARYRAEIDEILEAGPARSLSDRKSTRLNSSHGSISYAVFCLKKKK